MKLLALALAAFIACVLVLCASVYYQVALHDDDHGRMDRPY